MDKKFNSQVDSFLSEEIPFLTKDTLMPSPTYGQGDGNFPEEGFSDRFHSQSLANLRDEDKQSYKVLFDEKDTPDSSPSKKLNFAPLLRTIKRQFLLITIIAGGVSFVAWRDAHKKAPLPIYGGSFQILVEPITSNAKLLTPDAITHDKDSPPNADSFLIDYPTQMQVLQSEQMLADIAKQVRIKYPTFSTGDLVDKLTLERLAGDADKKDKTKKSTAASVLINPTKIIEVDYEDTNHELVDFVLKKTAERYLKYSLEDRKTRIGEGVKFIDAQLPKLQQQANTLQVQLQNMQQQYQIIDPKQQGQDLARQVVQMTNDQLAVQRELQEQRQLYASLQKQVALTPESALAATTLSQDPIYQSLRAKMVEVETQIAAESVRFLPGSPMMESLEEKRQHLQALLNQQTHRVFGQNQGIANNSAALNYQDTLHQGLTQQLVNVANQMKTLEVRNQKITQARFASEQQFHQFPVIALQYENLQRQLEIVRQTLDQLLARRETLRVQSAQDQVPWELIAPPQVTQDSNGRPIPIPAKSKIKNQLMMGAIGGLLLGIVAAIILEKYRDIFLTFEDLKDGIDLPICGTIPRYPGIARLHSVLPVSPTAIVPQSNSQFLQAFDFLYTNIHFLCPKAAMKSLAVCSATSGDGKSTIALHLAQTAAATGQRVLLVDANLRNPQIHMLLALSNKAGLSDILTYPNKAENVIERSLVENLWVLTSGQLLPDSARKLASPQMPQLMQKLGSLFDLVIYDTPSLLDFQDGIHVAACTSGVIMTVGVATTRCSKVKQALQLLSNFQLPILGVVANYAKPTKDKRSNKQIVDSAQLKWET